MNIGINLLNGTSGTTHLGCCCHFVLTAGSVAGHVILAFSCFALSLHGLVVGIHFITLLSTDDTFVKKSLDALIRLLGNFQTSLRLLQQVVGTTNLFLTGTVLGFQLQGSCCILGTLGLLHLGTDLWGVQNCQRVADLHIVAFFHPDFKNTSWHLTRHTILTHFNLPLNNLRITAQGKETYQGHNGYCCCKSDDCNQDVVMLGFC